MGRWARWRRRLARLLGWGALALALLVGAFFVAAYTVPLPARLAVRDSTVVTWRDGTVAHVFLAEDDRWRIAPVDLDPAYVQALVRLEDKRFFDHPGVDAVAIARALVGNLLAGRRVSGASTLTMQLVRLLEPRPRTWRSKLVEAFRALQLEVHLDKHQILAHYLRFVPYGRNVEGVEAAALAYFGHRADALTPAEIATLLAVPQGPRTRAPRPGNAGVLRRARDDIAARLLAEDALHAVGQAADPGAVLLQIHAASVPTGDRPFPREIPHAARWLRAQAPDDGRIPTTLDRGAQRLAQRRLTAEADALAAHGVHHGAVVVVEHATGAVRALVGNPRFGQAAGEQLAAFAVPRSSGSTLKPLIYARALDLGLALPGAQVPDVPRDRGGWVARNYDGQFAGLVRLEDALAASLNAPFVDLLSQVGVPTLLADLHGLGVRGLAPQAEHYGLAAAIGGVELSPLALAGAYTALASDGRFPGLRVRRDRDTAPARAIYDAGAVWLTRQALRRRDRPDFPRRRASTGAPAAVHWKTGTSAGHRDAWAVGSDPRHTVAVWLGNLDHTPSPALVGASAAGPVLFDVIEALSDPADRVRPDPPPPSVVQRTVCAQTGWPAGPACPDTAQAAGLVHAAPPADPHHLRLWVDAAGHAVAPGCRPATARPVLVWPPAVRRALALLGRPAAPLPPPATDCPPAVGAAPRITQPLPDEHVVRILGLPGERQAVPLRADAPVPLGELTWWVDDAPVGRAPADEAVFWPPQPGRHRLRVVDVQGRASEQRLVVR